jgi:hypothetical protein
LLVSRCGSRHTQISHVEVFVWAVVRQIYLLVPAGPRRAIRRSGRSRGSLAVRRKAEPSPSLRFLGARA